MKFYDFFTAFFTLQQSAPIGQYCGSKYFSGHELDGTVLFKLPQLLDFYITGDFYINCPNEPFFFDGNYIILQNLYIDGDCIHDNLKDNNIILNSIFFDDTTNQIQVSVKYSIANFDVSLSQCSPIDTI